MVRQSAGHVMFPFGAKEAAQNSAEYSSCGLKPAEEKEKRK
jgi:hypothetical protein